MKTRAGLPILVATLLSLAILSITACNKPQETTAAPGTGQVSAEVSDLDVTLKVKAALLRDDIVKGSDIAVVTTKGDVRLTGIVDSQNQIDQAIALARATEGVHSIHDELTLKK